MIAPAIVRAVELDPQPVLRSSSCAYVRWASTSITLAPCSFVCPRVKKVIAQTIGLRSQTEWRSSLRAKALHSTVSVLYNILATLR